MKKLKLAAMPGRGMFLAMTIGSTLLISSCKKEAAPAPDTTTTTTSQTALASANNLTSSFATTSATTGYKIVAPISLYNKSNLTISGDSIVGGSVACIQLVNCKNIHITNCKLGNSKSFGIMVGNSSGITIDYCNISNVATGILALSCTGSIVVQHNQVLNTQGPFPQGAGIQFSAVNGSNNHIDYNRIQNVVGKCNPEDKISIYKSYGVSTSPITVTGNMILGSGTSTSACGITLGDQGGSYQIAQNNTIVNSGAGGAQIAGGTYITITNNSIYSAAFPWSHMGLLCANYSGLPSNNLTVSYNKVNWTSGNPKDQINGSTTRVMNTSLTGLIYTTIGFSTNILGAAISASILPSTITNFLVYQ